MRISDWSSDVCSSDLLTSGQGRGEGMPASGSCSMRAAASSTASCGLSAARLRRARAIAPGRVGYPTWLWPQSCNNSSLQQFQVRSEEHTSELQSLMRISYAVFCLKKKNHDPQRETKHR